MNQKLVFILELCYIPYAVSKEIKRGYFIQLEKGKATLYNRPVVIFTEAEKAGAYQEAEPAKYVRISDEYYIRIGNDEAKSVSNKKDLIDAFPDNKNKTETFIKNNKVKSNKAEGLKELVNYYNSL